MGVMPFSSVEVLLARSIEAVHPGADELICRERRRIAMAKHTASMVTFFALVVGLGIGLEGIANARDEVRLKADLSGDSEVPPADPDGDGRARVVLKPDEGLVCFRVKFDDTGTPNRGHIHRGVAGQNGGIVVPFFELVGEPGDPRNDALERSELEDCVSADPALIAEIAANPEGFYVNLHNARFPGGAIRGQLED
jgi:CHRD domain